MQIFYQEPNGDYLAIETETHDVYHYTGKSQYEGRATAIEGRPTSVQTTAISAKFLAECAEVDAVDVPSEWREAIG